VTRAEEADFVRTFIDCRRQIHNNAQAESEANRRLCGLLGLWLYVGPAGQPLQRVFP
jgi:hypothetical protein